MLPGASERVSARLSASESAFEYARVFPVSGPALSRGTLPAVPTGLSRPYRAEFWDRTDRSLGTVPTRLFRPRSSDRTLPYELPHFHPLPPPPPPAPAAFPVGFRYLSSTGSASTP
ncbi:hypothetical protein TPA0910_15740 [Streptomyces hygroscopicus subsp. sporocinereus]|uniref:Uncharacterized protein n=1 Tax=Streptomyces hygroscopicus TaxID=1912 RepID=A0ABQ3TW31_STRHY|nr:hypothetical protein TPA0910_15740 [Streptomyces hygroscopicus]